MTDFVDWASLFVLGTVLTAVFVVGIQVGIRYQKLRDRKDGGVD